MPLSSVVVANHSPFFFFPAHRAAAAFLALSLRSCFESAFAVCLPPFAPSWRRRSFKRRSISAAFRVRAMFPLCLAGWHRTVNTLLTMLSGLADTYAQRLGTEPH